MKRLHDNSNIVSNNLATIYYSNLLQMNTRTIDTIVSYQLSGYLLDKLKVNWWINWCWGKWGTNFSRIIRLKIKQFPEFLDSKYFSLLDDIERSCYDHDIDFSLGWNYIRFLIANYKFAFRLYCLTNWATVTQRLLVSITVFFSLNIYGKKYFSFWPRKSLKYLLKNKEDGINNTNQ